LRHPALAKPRFRQLTSGGDVGGVRCLRRLRSGPASPWPGQKFLPVPPMSRLQPQPALNRGFCRRWRATTFNCGAAWLPAKPLKAFTVREFRACAVAPPGAGLPALWRRHGGKLTSPSKSVTPAIQRTRAIRDERTTALYISCRFQLCSAGHEAFWHSTHWTVVLKNVTTPRVGHYLSKIALPWKERSDWQAWPPPAHSSRAERSPCAVPTFRAHDHRGTFSFSRACSVASQP